jgi:hypothetical protein
MVTRGHLDKIKDETNFYQHQADGVRLMARMGSFLLADEMGLGKSLQALTVAAIDYELGFAKRTLIVCPATLKGNWLEEVEEHTKFSALVLEGTPTQRNKQLMQFASGMWDILIVNYEQVRPHKDEINALDFDISVWDEAHYLKNHSSKRTKAALGVHTRRRFFLTGSPMLNRADELWTILHMIDPTTYPDYWRFRNRYCNTPDAPILMADGTFKPIGKVQVGDEVVGWGPGGSIGRRTMCISRVEETLSRIAPEVIEATMESGGIVKCTPDHVWLAGTHNSDYNWITLERSKHNKHRKGVLSRVVDPICDFSELSLEQQRHASWLGGIYDGEGSNYFIAQSLSHNPEIYLRIRIALHSLDIPYTTTPMGISLCGGRQTHLKMINWCGVTKNKWFKSRLNSKQLNRIPDRVINVRSLGPGEVVSLQTSTGNYIAWGYASKNCVLGGFRGKQVVGIKNKAELMLGVNQVMIRRLKKDVLDLPEKQYIQIKVDLYNEQKKLYGEAFEDLKITLPGDPNPMELENALTKFRRLKEICGSTWKFTGEDHSAKLDRAEEICVEVIGNLEHFVVFSQFIHIQDLLRERLTKLGVPCYVMNGQTTKPGDRVPLINTWATGPPSVLIAGLQVGGVGLNLTQANKCLFIDKLFVPKLNEQAEDRLHRIGADQTKPVQIYSLICRGTIEMRVENILKRKTKLFDTLIENQGWKSAIYKAILESDDVE